MSYTKGTMRFISRGLHSAYHLLAFLSTCLCHPFPPFLPFPHSSHLTHFSIRTASCSEAPLRPTFARSPASSSPSLISPFHLLISSLPLLVTPLFLLLLLLFLLLLPLPPHPLAPPLRARNEKKVDKLGRTYLLST